MSGVTHPKGWLYWNKSWCLVWHTPRADSIEMIPCMFQFLATSLPTLVYVSFTGDCPKVVISKGLGYGIILGSCLGKSQFILKVMADLNKLVLPSCDRNVTQWPTVPLRRLPCRPSFWLPLNEDLFIPIPAAELLERMETCDAVEM